MGVDGQTRTNRPIAARNTDLKTNSPQNLSVLSGLLKANQRGLGGRSFVLVEVAIHVVIPNGLQVLLATCADPP
jgi:hypothetical protein